MVEKKTKSEAEPKAAKKAAAPKAAPVKAEAKKEAPAKAAPAKAAKPASGKTVTITQVGSAIGRQGYQRSTLIGLGLNKLHRTRTLEDTASVRGMIEKVKHLVKIVEAK